MCVIFCNIQQFSNDQMVYVLDGETGKPIFAQKVDLEDLPKTICTLAGQYDVSKVTLGGHTTFNLVWAEEIKSVYSLNYGKNNLTIEVL